MGTKDRWCVRRVFLEVADWTQHGAFKAPFPDVILYKNVKWFNFHDLSNKEILCHFLSVLGESSPWYLLKINQPFVIFFSRSTSFIVNGSYMTAAYSNLDRMKVLLAKSFMLGALFNFLFRNHILRSPFASICYVWCPGKAAAESNT